MPRLCSHDGTTPYGTSLEALTDSSRGTRSFNTKGMASEASLPEAGQALQAIQPSAPGSIPGCPPLRSLTFLHNGTQ